MLSLKQKAFIQTVAMVVGISVGSVLATLAIQLIPAVAYPWIAISALFAFAFYVLYGIILGRLEYTEKLKEMTEKKA